MQHYCGICVIAGPEKAAKPCGARSAAFVCATVARARTMLSAGMVAAIAATVAGLPAAAQEFVGNGGTGAAEVRPLPGFEAPGIKHGEFTLRSTVSTGVAYDSNILRTQTPVSSDYIYFVTPSFNLTRDGNKHIEELFASVTSAKYAKSGADDFTNAYARASETYLLSPGSRIVVTASVADGYERRVSSNYNIQPGAAEPVHYQNLLGSVGYRKSWANSDAGVTLSTTRQTFDDIRSTSGAILDQTYRNEDDLALDTFFNFRLSNRIQSNITFRTSSSDVHDQTRNADQWRLADTTTINFTSKTSFGWLVAVSEQDYYNNPQARVTPLGEYELFLQWSPVQRLSFTARGGYHDLGVNFERGIQGGGVGRYGSLDLTYLIRRDLQFVSSVRYENMHLSGDQGIQDYITGRAALTYEINQHAGLSFLYALQKMETSSPHFTPYDENIFQSTLNIRF